MFCMHAVDLFTLELFIRVLYSNPAHKSILSPSRPILPSIMLFMVYAIALLQGSTCTGDCILLENNDVTGAAVRYE